MNISSSPLRVLAVAMLSFAATLPAQSERGPELPPGCEAIRVPEGNTVSVHAYACGVQIYRWNVTTGVWDFVAPIALLFADEGGHGLIGLAHRVEHRQRLVDVLRPGEVDLFRSGRVAPLGVAAKSSGGKNPGDAFD